MKAQDRRRHDAKKQSLQDSSVIEHLARSLFRGNGFRGGTPDPGQGQLLHKSLKRRWTGGLPEF